MTPFEKAILRCYNLSNYATFLPSPITNSIDTAISSISIKTHIVEGTIEVPCILLKAIFGNWMYEEAEALSDEVNIDFSFPLILEKKASIRYPTTYKTSGVLLKYLLRGVRETEAFNLHYYKGPEIGYYGHQGLICYEDGTPMMMLTVTMNRLENGKWKPVGQNCRINKRVFRENDMLSKYIRGKFISNLAEMSYSSPFDGVYCGFRASLFMEGNTLKSDFKIIIDNLEDFIERPIFASVNTSSDDIAQYLADNADNFISTIDV